MRVHLEFPLEQVIIQIKRSPFVVKIVLVVVPVTIIGWFLGRIGTYADLCPKLHDASGRRLVDGV